MERNNKSYSPCIISWARYKLKIKNVKPSNSKKCSKVYWIDVIDYLLRKYPEFVQNRVEAINKFNCVKR